jgi:(2R)-ethylmalonyl-CoA mutase
VALVDDVMERLKKVGLTAIPVVVGGIIPPEDAKRLLAAGVARVYTPKDYDLNTIMDQIVDLIEARKPEAA